jgi:hypothetical protein
MILLTSASQIARVTGVSHQRPAGFLLIAVQVTLNIPE